MRILAYNVAHDSSVCVLNDGKLEFFCKEERLSRAKRASNPILSIEHYFDNFKDRFIDYSLFLVPTHTNVSVLNNELYKQVVSKKSSSVKVFEDYSHDNHHNCHAWLAYINSPFRTCLVFVVDRNGSSVIDRDRLVASESESVYLFNNEIKCSPLLKNFHVTQGIDLQTVKTIVSKKYSNIDVSYFSIAKVYEAATTLIGQHPLDSGKTMGLSSYGTPNTTTNYFDKNGRVIDFHFGHNSLDFTVFKEHRNRTTKNITKDNYHFYADRALEVQVQTQQQLLNLVDKYVSLTGINNVCIVGGYGLNVVANNFLLKQLKHVNFYFEPVSDDTGISLGACYKKHFEVTGEIPQKPESAFYHYYVPEPSPKGQYTTIDNLVDLLVSQKSLGIFDSSPEPGPRALGRRSILFDPRNKDGKEIVNKIKKREWYRPFAGVILKEHFSKYFDTLGLDSSNHMTITFESNELSKNLVPSIIHVDGTCRIQTVDESCGLIFELLHNFYKTTGCPMLLNTSMNLAGQPLVHTKENALELFNSSDLDCILFVDDMMLLSK